MLAPVALALHVGVSLAGAAVDGVDGVIAAMVIAPALFVAVLLVLGAGNQLGRVASEIALDTLRLGVLAAVAFGVGAGVASLLDGAELLHAVIALAIGGVIYAAGLLVLMPRAVKVLLGAGRGGGTASDASAPAAPATDSRD